MAARPQIPAPSVQSKKLEADLHAWLDAAILWARSSGQELYAFETTLLPRLWLAGRFLLQLFLLSRQQVTDAHLPPGRTSWVARSILTLVGKVTFARTYVWNEGEGGRCPTDLALGLTEEKCSRALMERGTRLATRMSFAQAHQVLSWFVPQPPAQTVLKEAVLGLGYFTQAFLEQMAPPNGDGEVLLALFDSKCVPTATTGELNQRRGPRNDRPKAPSPRHRGRQERADRPPRRRRKPGDKSKNGKGCTVVVMYTLRRQGDLLLGPINKRLYVSFGPKELAFQWARREATKRGFGPESTRTMQIVTDGDEDLATYTQRYFPKALHTLDVWHAMEYVWEAAGCLFQEGSKDKEEWFEKARTKVFDGDISKLLAELEQALAKIARTGPGNKKRRERMEKILNYLEPRQGMMNYAELAEQDLELGSGGVEGAVKHLVALRFDHGGMRWIRERAQALLQLRCIDQNGDWEAFLTWAMHQVAHPAEPGSIRRLQKSQPAPLPTLKNAA